MSISSTWDQLFPPKPQFVEKDVPNLDGKIYIVTGSNTGIGKELAKILYSKNATVYIAARSEEKGRGAIESLETSYPDSKGKLVYLPLDMADLSTIKESAAQFTSQETKLHVLFNNAGVMTPPQGSKTVQGYELQLGTNNLGAFLFTKLLTPMLVSTAREEPPNTVRVVWVSSVVAELLSHKPGGVPLDNLNYQQDKSPGVKYGISKAGNYLHATEFARRHKQDGIVSVPLNPGNLHSDLGRHRSALTRAALKAFIQYPPVFGAYTELFAGLSPQVTLKRSGEWVNPWGRFASIRKDLLEASKLPSEGGTGVAEKWWQWSEEQVQPYSGT